ncbi:MAG TPA: hypothetical protein VKP13_07505, partial [Nitrospira sp.]|nr:hypothetical protein [Nitrospira sp.]
SSACGSGDGNTWRCTEDQLLCQLARRSGGAWFASMIPWQTGSPFRVLTVVDNWSRSSPVLEAGFRMSGGLVSQVLDRILGEGQGVSLHHRRS